MIVFGMCHLRVVTVVIVVRRESRGVRLVKRELRLGLLSLAIAPSREAHGRSSAHSLHV